MLAGLGHCGIGTAGPGIAETGIDPLTALEQIEDGEPPDQLGRCGRRRSAPIRSRVLTLTVRWLCDRGV
jgi:hypothetical protein